MLRKPVIGVTPALNEEETRISLNRNFPEVLLACGALPVILPMTDEPAMIKEMIEACDGFVITGGGDIDPRCFGQQPRPCCGGVSPDRDAFELPLARMLHGRHDKPVLGICRGAQVMNVALGGTLLQDIATDFGAPVLAHRQKSLARYSSHGVAVRAGTLLRRIIGDSAEINSLHHQAAHEVPAPLVASAYAPDGVIEAVESTTHPFFLGLQWHPEIMWHTDKTAISIFLTFVAACKQNAQ